MFNEYMNISINFVGRNVADYFGGDACDDGVVRDIAGDDSAGGDDGAAADGDSRKDSDVAADPYVVADGDGFGYGQVLATAGG